MSCSGRYVEPSPWPSDPLRPNLGVHEIKLLSGLDSRAGLIEMSAAHLASYMPGQRCSRKSLVCFSFANKFVLERTFLCRKQNKHLRECEMPPGPRGVSENDNQILYFTLVARGTHR